MNITKESPVSFDPIHHKYTDLNGRELISVSRLLSLFKNPFDPDGSITKKYAAKHNMTVEEVLDKWKQVNTQSCLYGTSVHEEIEHYILTGEIRESDHVHYVNQFASLKFTGRLFAERMLYCLDNMVAGTADIVHKMGGFIDILDFKGLDVNTPIPTIDGFKAMQDIDRGDVIFDGDGNPTKVVEVSEVHYNPCYKITFDTNDTIICDHEHRWVTSIRTKTGNYRCRYYKVHYIDEEKTTDELFQIHSSGNPIRIKCAQSLKIPKKKLPIDPYVLGVWLGDGAKACGMVTNMNPRVWAEIEKRGYTLGADVSQGSSGLAQSKTVLGIYTELRKLNLIKNKHIPDIYLRASHKQRLDLLRGFMDTDGHYNKKRRRCVMITTRKWQSDALMELVSSLGWKPTLIKAKTRCTTTGCDADKLIETFHVTFKANGESPFLSRNDDYLIKSSIGNSVESKYRYVKKIEIIETVPTKCLSVDSPTHTYLAGRTYIKTHNTNKELKKFNNFGQKMLYDLSHLSDCNFNHYQLQLSTYGYMCELKGLKVNKLIILYMNPVTKKMEHHPCRYMRDEVRYILQHKNELL